MGAKDVQLRVIIGKVANDFVRKHHYSGKVVNNSKLHFGAFLNGKLHGVLSYGPPMIKRQAMKLVEGTEWNGMLELNRMAFDSVLPRNSESRCIAISLRMIKKQAPHVKWVLSFSDATSCGDGTIYRASGFVLTGIRENDGLVRLPDGRTLHKQTVTAHPAVRRPEFGGKSYYELMRGTGSLSWRVCCEMLGWEILPGYQLRYIRFLDPSWADRLTVPVIPFERIDELGAGMYKGERVTRESRHVTT